MPSSKEQIFLEGFQNLLPLYLKVKERIALAEEISGDVYLGAINEMRNALDHLMRAYERQESGIVKELEECKEHLIRAAFDSFDLVAMELLENNERKFQGFKIELIAKIYPDYFKEFIPKLNQMLEAKAAVRAKNTMTSLPNLPLLLLKSLTRFLKNTTIC